MTRQVKPSEEQEEAVEPEKVPEEENTSAVVVKEEPVERSNFDVFIGQGDVEEDEKKIEEERKRRMEEVQSEIAARSSRISFVDALRSKLRQQMSEAQTVDAGANVRTNVACFVNIIDTIIVADDTVRMLNVHRTVVTLV